MGWIENLTINSLEHDWHLYFPDWDAVGTTD